jgi:DNA-binding IclR family transcriptional regulator
MTFLADNAGESFTLSELSRNLEITKATVHSMVGALAQAGWIAVDHRKRYRLGPGLVAIASSEAGTRRAALAAAREPMRDLAMAYDVRVVASAAIGGDVVILAAEGHESPLGVAAEVGYRVPMVPPLGIVFLAWADPVAQQSWLAGGNGHAGQYLEVLEAVRRRGFSVTHQIDTRQRLVRALTDLATMPGRNARHMVADLLVELERAEEERAVVEIHPDDRFEEGLVTAPVFDAEENVVLALGLIGIRWPLTGAEILECGERLVDAARSVTEAINGSLPISTR